MEELIFLASNLGNRYTIYMIVVLDNLRSALNVGSIIRTCDALGVKKVYFCGLTPSPDNLKVKKTSLGAEKNIEAIISINAYETVLKLKQSKALIVALEITDKAIPVTFAENKNFVLVLGNEVSGVSKDILEIADKVVFIPMWGIKESLNVGQSSAIFMRACNQIYS